MRYRIAAYSHLHDLVEDVLAILDHRKLVDSDIGLPEKFHEHMNIQAVQKAVDGLIAFPTKAEVSRIVTNLKNVYTLDKETQERLLSVLMFSMPDKVAKFVADKLKSGVLPLSVKLATQLPYVSGKPLRKPVALALLDHNGYFIECSFSRDKAKEECSIYYRVVFYNPTVRDLLGVLLGKDAIAHMQKALGDEELHAEENAKELADDLSSASADLIRKERSQAVRSFTFLVTAPKPKVVVFVVGARVIANKSLLSYVSALKEAVNDAGLTGLVEEDQKEREEAFVGQPSIEVLPNGFVFRITIRTKEFYPDAHTLKGRFLQLCLSIIRMLAPRVN